ncbi:MAG: hypothetical protein QXV74_03885 [Candidatus Bathyarchaeia archaeon]
MNEEDFKAFLADLCDFLNDLEASIARLKAEIARLVGVSEAAERTTFDFNPPNPPNPPSWDPDKIEWRKAEGFKGEYERSEDVDNPEFKALLKDLAAHGGKLTRNGWFYWTFKNGCTVGRKRRVKV